MLNDVYPCPPNPMVPPLGLIIAIAASMEALDPIGPQYLRVDLLTRFEKTAFDGHRLKSIVDNNSVTWLETTDALSQAILRRLPCGDFFLDNAWAHLQVFWDWMSKRTSIQTLGHKLSEDELAEKGRTSEETEALRWMNGLCQQVLPTGKKATKEDVFLQLLKRFEIRGTELQKEIWKEAQIDGWRKGGSPGMKKK